MNQLGKITNPKVSLFYDGDIPCLSLEFDTNVINNIEMKTESTQIRNSSCTPMPPTVISSNSKISFDLGFNEKLTTCDITTEEEFKEVTKPIIDRQKLVGREVCIIENHENGSYKANNFKYMHKVYNKKVKLVYNIAEENECDIFITDFFLPEFRDEKNDYIYNGYLKVMKADFRFIEQ